MAQSLEWIFKKEFLEDPESPRYNTPNNLRKEKENRFKTVWFMKDLSNILRPPPRENAKDGEVDYDITNQKVFWTACMFFHRFYVFHSFESHSRFPVAVACLFLASKVEEKPLRLTDHIFLYFKVRKNAVLKKTEQEFKDMERDVLLSERILLQTLSFDLNVVHPFQYFRQIITKDLKSWLTDPDDSKQAMRLATTFLTDSCRSTLGLQYSPQQMAYGLVFLALLVMGIAPAQGGGKISTGGYLTQLGRSAANSANNIGGVDTNTTWLDVFERSEADEQSLKEICFAMVELYEICFSPQERPFKTTTSAEVREAATVVVNELDARRQASATQNVPPPPPPHVVRESPQQNNLTLSQLPATSNKDTSGLGLMIDTAISPSSGGAETQSGQNSWNDKLSTTTSQQGPGLQSGPSTGTTVATTLPFHTYSNISSAPTPPHGDAQQYNYFPPAISSANLEQALNNAHTIENTISQLSEKVLSEPVKQQPQKSNGAPLQVSRQVTSIDDTVKNGGTSVHDDDEENTSPYGYSYQNGEDSNSTEMALDEKGREDHIISMSGNVSMHDDSFSRADATPSFADIAMKINQATPLQIPPPPLDTPGVPTCLSSRTSLISPLISTSMHASRTTPPIQPSISRHKLSMHKSQPS